ncbi:MAG TPA: hypothetical protein VF816_10165 [Rhodocyclaceae bacterium]
MAPFRAVPDQRRAAKPGLERILQASRAFSSKELPMPVAPSQPKTLRSLQAAAFTPILCALLLGCLPFLAAAGICRCIPAMRRLGAR